jgi:broad specificity phosphatase PhoE
MSRTFVFVSAGDPQAAARAVAEAPAEPDLCVVSPSDAARETAAFALRGRWVFTVEEPLLAAHVPLESGDDVLARLAQALRAIQACDGRSPLVVCDELDILGATAFLIDEAGLARLSDDLERALPLP